jgi:hypothetical protein
MRTGLHYSLVLATLTALGGCGSDDDSGVSTASCHRYCEKRAPANCGLALDYDECVEKSCAVYDASDVSTACKILWERFHSCMYHDNPDVCTFGTCHMPALDAACTGG